MIKVKKDSSSLCCEPERHLKELQLISEDGKQNIRTPNHVPEIRICTCEDSIESMSNNIYSMPRRTEQMLQSPLHRNMRSAPMRFKESKNIYSEPRRNRELQKSPLHRDLQSPSLPSEDSENRELLPKRIEPKNIYSKPRRIIELLESPLHRDMRSAYMRLEESKNIYSEPRRIKELLKSPMHSDMRSSFISLENVSNNIYSEPRRTKEMMKSPLHRLNPVEESINRHSKPHLVKKLFKSPLHSASSSTSIMLQEKSKSHHEKDLQQSLIHIDSSKPSGESKNTYSQPRRIRELLLSPMPRDGLLKKSSQCVNSKSELQHSKCHKDVRPVGHKLQFREQSMNTVLERIANYFQQITAFQEISQRKIQQMGVQDFINIIGHLLANTGTLSKPLDKSNYIVQTINAMEQLNYPHKVRKSWLLMPCASLQHVLEMLNFLTDLLPME
ncbi:kinetochore and Eb1-associated basic protein [Drosophila innubila]|uniref:kinetochore and Eb1-associated basic protein n=1 Tax=Drosophila innubila TaxID=198719 RepID=UPI00148C4DAE|nr:kinetochore and Eb1-associated basic protein [Drosophila innubila]